MKTYRLVCLGCKVSRSDAAAIERALLRAGLVEAGGAEADLCVLQGCAVTAAAEGKSRRAGRRLRRENPGAKLLVSGCVAELPGFAESVGADGSLRAGEAGRVAELLLDEGLVEAGARGGDLARFPGRTRAFVRVQDGCEGGCSYCIVPRLRGAPRSRPLPEILEEARGLVDAGHVELVLVGVRLGLYRDEGSGAGLVELVDELLELGDSGEHGLGRLRMSSIEPADFDPRLIERLGRGVLCPHFHLPLQSADDRVLCLMKRPYRRADYERLVGEIRAADPDAAITTDVMAGFPGEDEEAFERTREFIIGAGFARVHAFPFSARPGTEAAKLEALPMNERRRRARLLIKAGRETARNYRRRFLGRELSVVAEPGKDGGLSGYTERYVRVEFEGPDALIGKIVRVLVGNGKGALTESGLRGEVLA